MARAPIELGSKKFRSDKGERGRRGDLLEFRLLHCPIVLSWKLRHERAKLSERVIDAHPHQLFRAISEQQPVDCRFHRVVGVTRAIRTPRATAAEDAVSSESELWIIEGFSFAQAFSLGWKRSDA